MRVFLLVSGAALNMFWCLEVSSHGRHLESPGADLGGGKSDPV